MRLLQTALFILTCVHANADPLFAQAVPRTLAERIRRVESGLRPPFRLSEDPDVRFDLEARMKELGVPGLSLAVVHRGRLDWARGYGLADIDTGRPVEPDTMFLAGSISKPVAAIRALQLIEQGTVNPDQNVNGYLKSWQLPDNQFTAQEKVTLRRILNHSAGLTVWGFPGYRRTDEIPSLPKILDGGGNTAAVRVFQPPGMAWRYSGGGYTIMQLLVTDLDGVSFPRTMADNVLRPMGMARSTYENPLPKTFHDNAATGYRADGKAVEGNWHVYPEMAAAGLWTTPTELIRYAQEVQRILRTQRAGVLKPATVELMLTPGFNNHGLGPMLTEHTFGHSGADEGFRARMLAWKETDAAVVVMVNSDNGTIMQEVLIAVAAAYDLPGFTQKVWKAVDMSEADLRKYVGLYRLARMGFVFVTAAEGGLNVRVGGNVLTVVPQDSQTFFDKSSGRSVRFELEGETVTGVTIVTLGLKATRINPRQ